VVAHLAVLERMTGRSRVDSLSRLN
jgi:hypothetical protein